LREEEALLFLLLKGGLSGRFASNVSRNSLGLCGKDFAAKFGSSKMLV
jgi:hypothetical protein